MKLKTILILLVALVAAVALVLLRNKNDADGINKAVGTKIFPGLVTEEVSTIVLNGGKEEVTLEIKDGKWTVKGRDGFPANQDNIAKLVTKVGTMLISDVKEDVNEKYLSRFKLQKPGNGGKDDETGTTVTLKKADGTVVADFTVGKNIPGAMTPGSFSNSQAQYIATASAAGQVLTIKEAFDYYMNNVTNKAWLDTSTFFKVEKPKSVSVTSAKPEDNWTLLREKEGTDAAELKLADPKPGEEFDTAKAGNSGGAFSTVTFADVATADVKDKTGLDQPLRTATIETFDGFKYTIKIGKQVEKPADANAGASEEYYVTVDVEASLAEKMPEPVPTPEDAKKSEEEKKTAREAAEKAFAENLTKLKEKLAKEKALMGRTYIIAKYNVEPLLKNRADFMKDKPAAPPAGGGESNPAAPPGAPAPTPGPVSATTPPVSIDIPPGDQVKPAIEPKPAEPKPAKELPVPAAPEKKAETPK